MNRENFTVDFVVPEYFPTEEHLSTIYFTHELMKVLNCGLSKYRMTAVMVPGDRRIVEIKATPTSSTSPHPQ